MFNSSSNDLHLSLNILTASMKIMLGGIAPTDSTLTEKKKINCNNFEGHLASYLDNYKLIEMEVYITNR